MMGIPINQSVRCSDIVGFEHRSVVNWSVKQTHHRQLINHWYPVPGKVCDKPEATTGLAGMIANCMIFFIFVDVVTHSEMVNHGKPTVICGPSQLSGAADHLELGLHPWQRPASARDTETLFRAADFLCALAETTPLEMMLALCLQYIIFKGPQGPHFL